ncbi:hypothetical protein JAAARDRAFT_43393 [Jaapia argillacea MUCL 33604]|uniref:D-lactate dehydratase n=1 Tax=Jaapia argillacea MUCL 33604 TaxID=933084 RepID=A0A067QBC0_9AGAM|nr:hypothetical protein JAAARDRAFT_43393 [Jaapia argillacea MUCL 33604]
MSPRVLFVYTSCNKTLSGGNTGWFLPEAAHLYYVLTPHCTIDFASPDGPNPPADEYSLWMFKEDADSVKFLQDETVKEKLSTAKKLSDISAKDYDAVLYVGGHGPVLDLATDPVNIKLANDFYRAGKVTSAVCHGQGALVGATDSQGKSIFVGKNLTCFSNAEESAVEKMRGVPSLQEFPFFLEDKIKSLGGKYEKADPWQSKVVVSDNLLTGQNPASSKPLGESILVALKA